MRLRPGPLTEASAVFGVGWIVALLIYMVALRGANTGFQLASFTAAVFFMPTFVVHALLGLSTKRKRALTKFLVNLSGTSVLTLLFVVGLQSLTTGVTLTGKNLNIWTNVVYIGTAGYYIGSIVGAAATYFWLTKEKR